MFNEGFAPEVGMKDYAGREILHTVTYINSPPGGKNLTVLLDKHGNLKICNILNARNLIINNTESIGFQFASPPVSFSLKGSGKKYNAAGFGRHDTLHQFDYDQYRNVNITPIYKDQTFKPVLFISRLKLFIIERKRNKLRRELKEKRKAETYGQRI